MKKLLNKIMSGVMAATMVFGILPAMPHTHTETTASAAQYDSYQDPALNWVESNGKVDELERNAIVTTESQICTSETCNFEPREMTIWRVPVYTSTGEQLTSVFGEPITSDGYKNFEKTEVGTGPWVSPTDGGIYTGEHWTKSYCAECHQFNTGNGANEYCHMKNVFVVNPCTSFNEIPIDVANTYVPVDSKTHMHTEKGGTYCYFCFGTDYDTDREVEEPHDGIQSIDPQIGNHRFVIETDCDKCGYNAKSTASAWVVISGYEGIVDGKDHTVSVTNYCDTSVQPTIRYKNDATGEYTLSSPPTYDEAGTYNVDYKITYVYNDRGVSGDGLDDSMEEYGTAQVILYPTTADDGDTTIIIPGDGDNPTIIDPDGDTVIVAPHSHEYKYQYTVDPTETSLGYEVWSCSCGEIQQRNFTIYEEPEVHIHDYVYQYTVEPTEDELGYEVWTCSCGMTEKRNYVSADTHTHNFTYQYTVAPTTTTLGYEIWACSCGQTEQRNHTATVGEDTHNFVYRFRSEPSCIAEGYELWQWCDTFATEKVAH